MRWRSLFWLCVSMLCFIGAVYFWRLGDQWAAEKAASRTRAQHPKQEPAQAKPASHHAQPFALLSQPGAPNFTDTTSTNAPRAGWLKHRLSNTSQKVSALVRNNHAILLENALLDTSLPGKLPIPDALRSKGDPGTYIVQSRQPLDNAFRGALKAAGASIVGFVPNNAYLVRASAEVAGQLEANPTTQAVLPFEPYYKLKPSLLAFAVEQQPLPANAMVNVLVFPDAVDATVAQVQDLGAQVVAQDRSPFGPVLRVQLPPSGLAALAGLSGVHEIERFHPRVLANDLSRMVLGVSTDSVTTTTYLDLTGTNVVIAMSDTGVDTNHPDLQGRVFIDSLLSGVDTAGHGTFVAGIIAGDGTESTTLTNVSGSVMPGTNGQFRGKAPDAKLLSMELQSPDYYIQETAARTNVLIENNSWTYGIADYDLAAASYDAAVRDAVPEVTGPQSLAIVFPAGNGGGINNYDAGNNDGGTGGSQDTIQSPGTAKNVITVGAVEQLRSITNQTWTTSGGQTNEPWAASTDSSNQVANFSSRGNVGYGVEGDHGRFKPDVVAPGTFVVSTRSSQWDEQAYYNPTNYNYQSFANLTLASNAVYSSGTFVPNNAVQMIVSAQATSPITDLGVEVIPPNGGAPIFGINQVSLPPDGNLSPVANFWSYTITNPQPIPVTYTLSVLLVSTNDHGNFLQVLSNMNNSIGTGPPYYYRYESGTSLAAASVSGVMGLMQEFLEQRTQGFFSRSNPPSPALLKALLINGARSLGDQYDFQVRSSINYQGWGQVYLPNSLPGALSNLTTAATAPNNPIYIFDQSPTNALSTGQSHTRFFTVASDAQAQPLRVTLVWSDPPGDPVVGIKLVNDLDVVVTNLDDGTVYFGNDIRAGNDFSSPWDTNTIPNVDSVNNVENVYLQGPLGTNYSVTVIGHRVNVNAVPENPNDVVQDYALVVSSGDGTVPDALTMNAGQFQNLFVTLPNVYFATNQFPYDPEDPVSGAMLFHQRVGADTPLMGTNTVPLPTDANAVITLGMTNQWHFYVLSNQFNFTNASFITFLPPNLSVPRMGVTNVNNPNNATRPEADIDMYVSTDFNITNLSPSAIAAADKSLGRGGTEYIYESNAAPGAVYYVGIKSEDQQSADYNFLGVFSLYPPSITDGSGNVYTRAWPVPAGIPQGSASQPGGTNLVALVIAPIQIQRVIVTNSYYHTLPGNLVGTLNHGTKFAVLNNHTCVTDATGNCYTNLLPLSFPGGIYYEDNGQGDIPLSRHTDGPGSLKDFIGDNGVGPWLFSMVNNFPSGDGYEYRLWLKLEPQNLNTNGSPVTLAPDAWYYDSIDVPPDATNLTVCVSGNTAPIDLYVSRGSVPSATTFDYHLTVNPPGDCLPITIFDTPPLVAGKYYIGVHNTSATSQTIRVLATLYRNPFAVASSISGFAGPVTIQDDAITYAYITNNIDMAISSLDVGLLISDPRISDLAISLISPDGTRVLLFENRGGLSTNGLGTFSTVTNAQGLSSAGTTNIAPFYTNNFDDVPTGTYTPGAVFDGWNVLSNSVLVYPEMPAPWLSNNVLLLTYGGVSNSLPTTNSSSYSLSFEVTHAPYLVGTVGWWPFDRNAADVFGGHDGLFFGDVSFDGGPGEVNQAYWGDGVATRMIVPRCPQLDLGLGRGFTVEGWINPANVTNSAPLVEWNDTGTTNLGIQFWLNGGFTATSGPGSLSLRVWDTNSQPYSLETGANAVTNGGWQHVAVTFDGASGAARLYIDGQLTSVGVLTAGVGTLRTSGDVYFGYHPPTLPNNFVSYQGGLDEFGIYERALSDCEVAAIYNAGTGGKYGTNVLSCPVTNTVQIVTSAGLITSNFVNGLTWTNGPQWETNVVAWDGQVSNAAPIIVSATDPNVAVDNFVLSALQTNYLNGLMHFSEDTNLALVPIKFAPAPYAISNFPPTIVFSNDFTVAMPGIYQSNAVITGSPNDPGYGPRDWTVLSGPVTVVSNSLVDAISTNSVALATGSIQCTLPTIPGTRYQLTYNVRGPGAVSWWTGDIEPSSQRAWDLLGGNNGALINLDTNLVAVTNVAPGFVGRSAFYFNGEDEPTPDTDFGALDTDDSSGKLELGDPANLRLTNGFTIEGWINPVLQTNYVGTEQILFRGDSRDCREPYYLALEPYTANQRDLHFHIQDQNNPTCGFDLVTTNGPLSVGGWSHFAAVFDKPFTNFTTVINGTNTVTIVTNQLRLYLNGVCIASNYTTLSPFRDLDPAFSPGVSIGNRSRYDFTQPFRGYLDELTVYGRALTDPEIQAIYNANGTGKADFTVPPGQSLAEVNVLLDDILRDTGHGDNSQWTTRTVVFTADHTNTVLTLQSVLPGTLVDGVTLTQLPAELNYLPEDSLSALNGENAKGVWTLEIWDNRLGISPTNALPALLNWQLNFILLPSNPPPVIHLAHGIAYTNTLVAHGVQNFVVDVPQWAMFTTNSLLLTTNVQFQNNPPVGVLFDLTNQAPSDTNLAIFWPPVTNGTDVLNLNTNTLPYIVPGQPYYLTVTNPNPVSVTFAYSIWFDITTLTNCQAQSNFVAQAGIPRYFQFDVPSPLTPTGAPPQAVTFLLSGVPGVDVGIGSNVTVVLSQHLPLPDLTHFDYINQLASTNDNIVVVVTNTTPFPLQTNRWYAGVFSQASTNVPFFVEACYTVSNYPVIIPLTNGVEFTADFASPYVAPPGPPQWFFFEFQVTNSPRGILFELYNVSGDADLVLQRDVPPAMPPYLAGSFSPGLQPEQIVVRPGQEIPDLFGNWYLGVINNESVPVAYTLRATTPTNGLLLSAQPLQETLTALRPPQGLLFQWNSVLGELYIVQHSTDLRNWQDLSGFIRATTPLSTYQILPVPTTGSHFYRVVQVSEFSGAVTLTVQPWPGNQLRLSWSTNFPGETLQSSFSPQGPWQNVNLPVQIIGNQYVVFYQINTTPIYFRLVP
ncbi:MAG TPA: LamG-like jellyroll fold domain-containing protein [Verrucomicrobiae bacterium]|nr:LamG-like jellyroll fold domain-containing protein [Verrucomicrobiae bacterium]